MKEIPVIPPNNPSIRARVPTLITIAVVVVVLLVIIPSCISVVDTGFGAETTYDPPGSDNTRYDPIAAVGEIQAQIGEGTELISLSSTYVKSDGTQDLVTDLYTAVSNYEFVREVPPPDNAPPIGAGGSTTGRWYQITQVDIYSPGQWRQVTGSTNYTYLHKGMDLDNYDPTGTRPAIIPLPRCSFATLWEQALKDDVPESAVAFINYDSDGYEFYISDLGYRAEFDMECQYLGE